MILDRSRYAIPSCLVDLSARGSLLAVQSAVLQFNRSVGNETVP